MAGLLLISLVLLSALPALAAEGRAPAGQAAMPAAQGPVAQATPGAPAALVRAPDAVAGKAIYEQSCTPCHGAIGDGKGASAAGLNANPTAFNDFKIVAGLPLSEFFKITKAGRMDKMMPPWGSRLSDQQIWDAVGYAWTLHTSSTEIQTGKQVYEANCASCHGADGKGKNGAPDLTNFATTSTQTQNDWVQVIAKGKGQMPAFDGKLKPEEQRASAEYARSLSFTRMFPGPLATGSGVITGTIINATTGQIMAGLPITLTVFDNQTLSENRPSKTDASGKYQFGGLPTDSSLEYQVSTVYPANVPYATDPTTFPTDTVSMALPLHVFETTTDGSGISADRLHFIVEFDPASKMAQIAELVVFSHDSDKTYVGDKDGAVLRITLPTGAQQLQPSDGELGKRFRQTSDGFVDTLPLPPGPQVRQVLFRYLLPYDGDKLDLVRSLPYPAANVNALVSAMGEQVASSTLQNQGTRQTQMGDFFNLSGQNVAANQPITLQFTNLSQVTDTSAGQISGGEAAAAATPAASTTDRLLLIALVAVVGMGAGFLAAWPLLRRRQTPAGAQAGAPDREGLIDALARLDMAHEAHELSDADYREQRIRLKAQLLDLMNREGAR